MKKSDNRQKHMWGVVVLVLLVYALCRTTSADGDKARANSCSSPIVAFVHANVVPMSSDKVLADYTVVVCKDRVTTMGPSTVSSVITGARTIDATNKYLMPGLVDAHVHLLSPVEFRLYLFNGVTTVFNLDGRPAHLKWRKEIANGTRLGPMIVTSGPIFRLPHTPEEDVQLVDEQARQGYDAIKIYNRVSKAEYPTLITEAKRHQMLLVGHVAREPGFEMTLAFGQSIAHLEEFVYTYFNPLHDDQNSHVVFDEAKIHTVSKETAAAHVAVITTLNMYATIVQQATDLASFLKNPRLRYVAPWTLKQFQPEANSYHRDFAPSAYGWLRESLAFQRKLMKGLFNAHVPLVAGTDATEVGPLAGFGLHDELEELVRDGLTPLQALQTATVNPAIYFHREHDIGVLEPGKRADLVMLDGNPLSDISNTRRIAGVMAAGRWLARDTLETRLAQVPALYRAQEDFFVQVWHSDPMKAHRFLNENDPFGRLELDVKEERGLD